MNPHPMNKTVGDVMNPRVVTALRGTNGEVLARQLLSGHFSGVPIVEAEGEVVGVVTEFDLLQAYCKGGTLSTIKAEEIMTTPPLCLVEETPLGMALQKMIDNKVIRLPVVRHRKIVGVISRANVLSELVDLETPAKQILPFCYWCERVRDNSDNDPEHWVWYDLPVYLELHHLDASDVSFMHVYCPQCALLVDRGSKGPSRTAWES